MVGLILSRSRALLGIGIGVGLCLGLACKDGNTQPPGDVTAVEGPAYCPRSVPAKGASCPRGNSDFCVYRTTGGDYACICGAGAWSCAAK